MSTGPTKRNRKKLFTIIGSLMVVGATLAVATASFGLDGLPIGDGDVAVEAAVPDPTDLEAGAAVELPEEIEELLGVHLDAAAQLSLEVKHDLESALDASMLLRAHAEELLQLGLSLDGEAKDQVVATAQAILAEVDKIEAMIHAEHDKWLAMGLGLSSALDGTDEQLIKDALEGQLDAAAEIEARIAQVTSTLEQLNGELEATLDMVSSGFVSSLFVGKSEVEKATQATLVALESFTAQLEGTTALLGDVTANLLSCLEVLVDVEAWLILHAADISDAPIVGVIVSEAIVLVLCPCPDEPKEPEDPTVPEDPKEPEDPSVPEDPKEPEDPSVPEDPNETCAGPQQITAVNDGATNVVSWSGVGAADSYRVYRAEAGGEFEFLVETGATHHQDAEVEVGTTYSYRVTAVVDGMETEICDTVEITAIPVFATVLAALAAVGLGLGGYAFVRRRS